MTATAQAATASISGLIVDKKELPIAGALVVANPPPFMLIADTPIPAPVGRTTDAGGRYDIEGLPDGVTLDSFSQTDGAGDLVRAIHEISLGRTFLSPSASRFIARPFLGGPDEDACSRPRVDVRRRRLRWL